MKNWFIKQEHYKWIFGGIGVAFLTPIIMWIFNGYTPAADTIESGDTGDISITTGDNSNITFHLNSIIRDVKQHFHNNPRLENLEQKVNKALEKEDSDAASKLTLSTLNDIGNEYKRQGQYDDAIYAYDKALSLNENFDIYYERADAYMKNKDYQKAISDYNAAERISPNHFGVYYNRATAYMKEGQYGNAVSDFSRAEAIQPKPKNWKVYYNRANAYKKLGDVDEAISDYRESLKKNPNNSKAHYNIADAYRQKGDINNAVKHFEIVVELEKDNSPLQMRAKKNLEVLLR